MKSVSISLEDGWATELWKIKRLYSASFVDEKVNEGEETFSVRVTSCDPRLGSDLSYGFPPMGIRAVCKIPLSYQNGQVEDSFPTFTVIESTDKSRKLPDGFADRLTGRLHSELHCGQKLPLFSALKATDRFLPDMWIESILDCLGKPDEDVHVAGAPVTRLTINVSLPILISRLEYDLCCLKCDRLTGESLSASGFLRFESACSTCSRWVTLSGPVRREFFGIDCAIHRVRSLSAWVLCECGKGCAWVANLRPHVCSDLSFSCGCSGQEFSFRVESLVRLPKLESPKVKFCDSTKRVFKEGSSLPSNGACKHYKKSFRWIKYGCCGDWYACNQCHEAYSAKCEYFGESSEMMCGFCSRQQPMAGSCEGCAREVVAGWSVRERVSWEPKRRFRGRKKK